MTLGQIILSLIGLVAIVYFVRKWVVDLGLPGSLIYAIIGILMPGQCPVHQKNTGRHVKHAIVARALRNTKPGNEN